MTELCLVSFLRNSETKHEHTRHHYVPGWNYKENNILDEVKRIPGGIEFLPVMEDVLFRIYRNPRYEYDETICLNQWRTGAKFIGVRKKHIFNSNEMTRIKVKMIVETFNFDQVISLKTFTTTENLQKKSKSCILL